MLVESHCIIVVRPVIWLLVTLFLRVIGRLIDHGLLTLIVTLIKSLLSVLVCVFKIGLRRILILVWILSHRHVSSVRRRRPPSSVYPIYFISIWTSAIRCRVWFSKGVFEGILCTPRIHLHWLYHVHVMLKFMTQSKHGLYLWRLIYSLHINEGTRVMLSESLLNLELLHLEIGLKVKLLRRHYVLLSKDWSNLSSMHKHWTYLWLHLSSWCCLNDDSSLSCLLISCCEEGIWWLMVVEERVTLAYYLQSWSLNHVSSFEPRCVWWVCELQIGFLLCLTLTPRNPTNVLSDFLNFWSVISLHLSKP